MLGNPEEARKIDATYKFVVAGNQGGTWVFQCRDPLKVTEEDSDADCVLNMEEADFVALGNGKLNPQIAFLMGKIKLSGDLELALRLHRLF